MAVNGRKPASMVDAARHGLARGVYLWACVTVAYLAVVGVLQLVTRYVPALTGSVVFVVPW